jgi:Na+/glutamate symporter
LVAVLFVGSLSLFFSIFTRRAYVAIIANVLTIGVIFALILMLVAYLVQVHKRVSERVLFSVLQHVNPYVTLVLLTDVLMNPAWAAGVGASWHLCCVLLLTATAIVLCASITLVRKVALLQATGQLGKPSRARKTPPATSPLIIAPHPSVFNGILLTNRSSDRVI